MPDQCSYCLRKRIPTNHLVLNEGKMWIEFCEECGKSQTLTNAETGEVVTVQQLFDRSK